jgi:SAM-dependent methyltransferase
MRKDLAQQYGNLENWHWWFRGRQSLIQSILGQELKVSDSRRILSVGCGPSEGLGWLLPFAGPHGQVVGLDIEAMHAPKHKGSIGFVVGSLDATPLATASFDLVLALDVLEHIDDDSRALAEAVRLVKPHGLLLLTVPALPSLWGGQDVVSEHRRRYTKRTLIRLFKEAGLSRYEVKYFNTFLFPLVATIRWSRRALGFGNRPRTDFEDNRPGVVNDALARVFGAESHMINRLSMPIGVSLLAKYKPVAPRDIR